MATPGKVMTGAGWVITVLVALMMVMSGTFKLMNPPQFAEQWVGTFGYPTDVAVSIGIVEISCAVLYLIPPTTILGAVLLTGYLGGAIATHVRIHDGFFPPAIIGVFVWLGVYLRDQRVRAILPLRWPATSVEASSERTRIEGQRGFVTGNSAVHCEPKKVNNMFDDLYRRRHFLRVAGATGALAAAGAAHGENGYSARGQTEKVGEPSPSPSTAQPKRREQAMSSGGLSKARLDRMHEVMAGHVEHGGVPGLVTLISRRGQVHVDAIGMKAAGGKDPMRRDTIFRIASMTKPITAVATMILVEECKLRLDEPVDRLLPELAKRKVLKRLDGPIDDTVPANRPITVRDLLTFRMGLGIIMAPPDTYPIQKAIAELKIQGMGRPNPSAPHSPDEWIRRLATLPLVHQPGEQWMYNIGSYVLSVLVARASGKLFDTFLRERIFEPLGMKDTGFYVPAEKLDRLATNYNVDAATGALELEDGVENSKWGRPPASPDGAGGLVSTVDDFLAFSQMLLNKGKYGRARILSRPSVETMTIDHLTPQQKAASPFPGLWDNRGWGFGVCVVIHRDGIAATPGQYGWNGGFGTSWSNDPAEEMIGIIMTQRPSRRPSRPMSFRTSGYRRTRRLMIRRTTLC